MISSVSGKTSTGTGSGADLNFDFNWDSSAAPNAAENIRASNINQFYLSNMVHDISYAYGFVIDSFNYFRMKKAATSNKRTLERAARKATASKSATKLPAPTMLILQRLQMVNRE